MTDRKELIDILKHCMEGQCNTCPNHFSDGRAACEAYMHGIISCMPVAVIQNAIDMLKKQEAVPVIQREIAHMLFWCCSSCGVAITDGDKFCRNCGKGLIWE